MDKVLPITRHIRPRKVTKIVVGGFPNSPYCRVQAWPPSRAVEDKAVSKKGYPESHRVLAYPVENQYVEFI